MLRACKICDMRCHCVLLQLKKNIIKFIPAATNCFCVKSEIQTHPLLYMHISSWRYVLKVPANYPVVIRLFPTYTVFT